MINDIHSKLQSLLNEDALFQRESEVVYFLVEVRKIIEKKKLYSNYPILLFYCDWIVHPQIDHDRTIQHIKPILDLIEQGNGYAGMSQMHKMDPLKLVLSQFLSALELKDFTKDIDSWKSFFYNLRNVLVEQPIEIDPMLGYKVANIRYMGDFQNEYIPLDVNFNPNSNGHKRSVQYNANIE